MKSFNIFLVLLIVLSGCKEEAKQTENPVKSESTVKYVAVGKKIDITGAKNPKEITGFYKGLSISDSISTKFKARVKEVCQAKGCWMKVVLDNEEEAMVRFKDYGFFVPKDIAGKEVVINGLAFVEETSVEDLKHLAEDAGKSKEEIAKITDNEKTYGFEADGVLILE
ncbi:MAG: DUF4920 domain-containing protein [Flavobacteriaceae bacterium]